MREIVLDTETTGLDPRAGHRVVEIGCVELINHAPTERKFQCYVNPERDMPEAAFAVHGLSADFLSGQPVFAAIADDFMGFLGDAPLIIHNASFDLGFINAELERLNRPPIPADRAVDTVAMARAKFPGAQVNLNALCRRFQIDNSDRELHGALKDSLLLAGVYLELIGGRQPGLELAAEKTAADAPGPAATEKRAPRPHAPDRCEAAAHAAFLENVADPIWRA